MKKVIKCTHCGHKIGSDYCYWKSDVPKCEEYYCSVSCAVDEHSIKRVRWVKCENCGKFTGNDAVVDKSGSLYCCFECALSANGVEVIKKPVKRCCICGLDGDEKYFKKNEALFCGGCVGRIIIKNLKNDPNGDFSNQTIVQALKTLGFEEVKEDEKE